MEREELMKVRLTELGKKQGMIDDTENSASIEYISGFIDGWKEADKHPKSPWVSMKESLPQGKKDNELYLLKSRSGDFLLLNHDINDLDYFNKINRDDFIAWMLIPELPEGGEL